MIYCISTAIKHQIETDPHNCSFHVEYLMNALYIHLLKNYCTVKPKLKNYRNGLSAQKTKLIIDYIDDNFDSNITLIELANLVNISQYYFCRLFRKSIGITPY